MYRKKTYLDKLLALRQEYVGLEDWVNKERERVLKLMEKEEPVSIPPDLVTRKEAASILGCSTRTVDRLIKDHHVEKFYPRYTYNVKHGLLYFRREDIERLKYRTRYVRILGDLASWL